MPAYDSDREKRKKRARLDTCYPFAFLVLAPPPEYPAKIFPSLFLTPRPITSKENTRSRQALFSHADMGKGERIRRICPTFHSNPLPNFRPFAHPGTRNTSDSERKGGKRNHKTGEFPARPRHPQMQEISGTTTKRQEKAKPHSQRPRHPLPSMRKPEMRKLRWDVVACVHQPVNSKVVLSGTLQCAGHHPSTGVKTKIVKAVVYAIP